MELAYDLIGTYGFPVFVCLWFMLRTEKIIKGNTDAINNMRLVIDKCQKK